MTKLERIVANKYLEVKVRCYNLERLLGVEVLNELVQLGYIYPEDKQSLELTGLTLKKHKDIAL